MPRNGWLAANTIRIVVRIDNADYKHISAGDPPFPVASLGTWFLELEPEV